MTFRLETKQFTEMRRKYSIILMFQLTSARETVANVTMSTFTRSIHAVRIYVTTRTLVIYVKEILDYKLMV